MHYLYGDSSTAPFTANFLEFLRDAIDFCVYVLEANERIRSGRQNMDELRRRADVESAEIEALGSAVAQTIQSTPKGAADSPAAACATRMITVCDETVRSSLAAAQARLATSNAQAEAEEATERDGCLQALLMLLAPHVPPDASTVLGVRLHEAGGYEAVLAGSCPSIDLTWRRELEVPDGHPFKQLLRVDSLQRRLELSAPELTGWIKKQVAVRPQHVERHVITEAIAKDSKLVLRLRAEPGSEAGFDLESDAETGHVTASRLVSGADQVAAGPFEVDDEDVPKVIELCEIVRGHLAELRITLAFEATFGETDFQSLGSFVDVVERFVAYLSPMVHEIAKHSLEPDELVLRRALADNRREEIFVSKTTLRDKYEHLAPELRGLFAPLGLRATLSRSVLPAAPASFAETTRSELPPSNPPPPPAKPVLAGSSLAFSPVVPPPPPTPTFSSGVEQPTPAAATPSRPAARGATASKPLGPPAPSKPIAIAAAPSVSATRASSPGAPPVTETPASTRTLSKPVRPATSDAQAKPEVMPGKLRRVLEKIVELDGAERWPEAHGECATLLEGAAFGSYALDDQRRVLKLLLVLETRATPSDARVRALRAGRDRSRALIERMGDPADYELLGLCQVALDESDAANETFRKGLELESGRNAESDLCGRLKRHAGAA